MTVPQRSRPLLESVSLERGRDILIEKLERERRLSQRYRRERNRLEGELFVRINTVGFLKAQIKEQERTILGLSDREPRLREAELRIERLEYDLNRTHLAFLEGRREIETLAETILGSPSEPILAPLVRIAVRDVIIRRDRERAR